MILLKTVTEHACFGKSEYFRELVGQVEVCRFEETENGKTVERVMIMDDTGICIDYPIYNWGIYLIGENGKTYQTIQRHVKDTREFEIPHSNEKSE